jgi:hypothetical protein
MSDKTGKGKNKPPHTKATIARVMAMEANEFNALSVEFAKTCVRAGVSPLDAAYALRVTRGAVHRWMKGNKIREERRPTVQLFVDALNDAVKAGDLPKPTRIAGSQYIEKLYETSVQ